MLKGVLVALVTPMLENSEIDWLALEKLIDFHIKNKTNALVILGTTGEGISLDHYEKAALIRFVISRAADKIKVIAGVGTNNLAESIELAQKAETFGCNSFMAVVPFYLKTTQEGLYYHFKTISSVINGDLMLYNVPARTSYSILPETIARLNENCLNIKSIKEASGNLECEKQIRQLCGENFAIFSGDDVTFIEHSMQLNLDGVVSVSANIIPNLINSAFNKVLANDFINAKKENQKLSKINNALTSIAPNPITIKYAMYRLGMIKNSIRLPLVPLKKSNHQQIDDLLIELNLM